MHHLFPKDTSMYITILRDPVDQFESVFNYMEFIGEVWLRQGPKKIYKVISQEWNKILKYYRKSIISFSQKSHDV